jgi:hypothetical protein
MENQELRTPENKTLLSAFQKAFGIGLIFTWLVAFAGLVLAIRSSLAPTHYSIWVLAAWVIAEIFLSLIIVLHLIGFIYELFRYDNEHVDNSSAGGMGVLLTFVALGFLAAAISLPLYRNFEASGILNFVLFSFIVVADVLLLIKAYQVKSEE